MGALSQPFLPTITLHIPRIGNWASGLIEARRAECRPDMMENLLLIKSAGRPRLHFKVRLSAVLVHNAHTRSTDRNLLSFPRRQVTGLTHNSFMCRPRRPTAPSLPPSPLDISCSAIPLSLLPSIAARIRISNRETPSRPSTWRSPYVVTHAGSLLDGQPTESLIEFL